MSVSFQYTTGNARNRGHAWADHEDTCLVIGRCGAPGPVTISLDGQPAVAIAQIEGFTLWMLLTKMRTGVTHSFQHYANGKPLGARGDAVGDNPDSYPKPGVAKGKVGEKHTIVSKIYDGMKADYWIYASPGVDPAVPAPLMVWQDGQGLVGDFSPDTVAASTEA